MLALKFCIPPSISVGGGLKAELDALPPKVDADFHVTVDVGAGPVVKDAAAINVDLEGGHPAADRAEQLTSNRVGNTGETWRPLKRPAG